MSDGARKLISTRQDEHPWLMRTRPVIPARLRLLAIPYAGGGPQVFHGWEQELPPEVELCAVQLPGRVLRFGEQAWRRLDAISDAVTDALPDDGLPFVIFGHSMGALVGFEVARELRRRGRGLPVTFVASAFRAPHLPDPQPSVSHWPDAELARHVHARFGSIPAEITREPALMALLLPTLRADLEVLETYAFVAAPPLECPIVGFGGEDDTEVDRPALEAWSVHTRSTFRLSLFPGGHFFIDSAREPVLRALCTELNTSLRLIDPR